MRILAMLAVIFFVVVEPGLHFYLHVSSLRVDIGGWAPTNRFYPPVANESQFG